MLHRTAHQECDAQRTHEASEPTSWFADESQPTDGGAVSSTACHQGWFGPRSPEHLSMGETVLLFWTAGLVLDEWYQIIANPATCKPPPQPTRRPSPREAASECIS